jgi:hypothetical protein
MENIPMVSILNCTTGETTTRPLTAEEIEERETLKTNLLQQETERQAQALAKASAKASAEAKLAALGLTTEEISALY